VEHVLNKIYALHAGFSLWEFWLEDNVFVIKDIMKTLSQRVARNAIPNVWDVQHTINV
jgi:hypothetical protein